MSILLSDSIVVQPAGPIVGSIQPPGSKSLTNRALICAALGQGESRLRGALDSEDTRVMIQALQSLGINVSAEDDGATLTIAGQGGDIPSSSAELFLANSGTSIRFLTAMVAAGRGTYRLDGIQRMRQRPIADLVDALNQLGSDVSCINEDGCPPVQVVADGLPGGHIQMRGDVSSQYLSAVLMIAPCSMQDVVIELTGELVSRPYVEMTRIVMEQFGVACQVDSGGNRFVVPAQQQYESRDYAVEPDASAASYFWAAAAISGGDVTVEGLSKASLQGDVGFCECLEQMGCTIDEVPGGRRVRGGTLRGIDVDMNSISDTVQTLAAVALFADGPTRVRGVAHNRHKETDRIGDLATELRKLGARVEEFEDGLEIHPGKLQGAEIETYNDHRMAMSLALVGLRIPKVRILNPGCTVKTYPHYFDDLANLVGAG